MHLLCSQLLSHLASPRDNHHHSHPDNQRDSHPDNQRDSHHLSHHVNHLHNLHLNHLSNLLCDLLTFQRTSQAVCLIVCLVINLRHYHPTSLLVSLLVNLLVNQRGSHLLSHLLSHLSNHLVALQSLLHLYLPVLQLQHYLLLVPLNHHLSCHRDSHLNDQPVYPLISHRVFRRLALRVYQFLIQLLSPLVHQPLLYGRPKNLPNRQAHRCRQISQYQ